MKDSKSLFNLINIFRRPARKLQTSIMSKTNCDQNAHHDYYCDAEKPFIG